jgi:hypothetical protein
MRTVCTRTDLSRSGDCHRDCPLAKLRFSVCLGNFVCPVAQFTGHCGSWGKEKIEGAASLLSLVKAERRDCIAAEAYLFLK